MCLVETKEFNTVDEARAYAKIKNEELLKKIKNTTKEFTVENMIYSLFGNVSNKINWKEKFINIFKELNIEFKDHNDSVSIMNDMHTIFYDKGNFFNEKNKYVLISLIPNGVIVNYYLHVFDEDVDISKIINKLQNNESVNDFVSKDIDNVDIEISKFIDIMSFGDNYNKVKERLFNIISDTGFRNNITNSQDPAMRLQVKEYQDENNFVLTSKDTLPFFGIIKDDVPPVYELVVYPGKCTLVKVK